MPLKVFYNNQPLREDLVSVDINQADFIYTSIKNLNEINLLSKPFLLNLQDPLVTFEHINSSQYYWIDDKKLDEDKINFLEKIAERINIQSATHQKLNLSIKEIEHQNSILMKKRIKLQEQKKINLFENIQLQQQYYFFYEFIKEVEDTENLHELLNKLAKFFQRHTGIKQCGFIQFKNQQPILILPNSNQGHILPYYQQLQHYHIDDLYFYENRLTEVTQIINSAYDYIHLMPLEVSNQFSVFFILSGELKVSDHYNWLLNLQSLLKTKIQSLSLLQNIKKNSLIWKSAFNQLGLAVAILDEKYKIVLSNIHYRPELHALLLQSNRLSQLQGEISYQDQLYHYEIIDIILTDQRKFKCLLINNIQKERESFNQFLQKQKLELMARLSDRIAHDLLNPIGGIQSLTELLLSETVDPKQILYIDDLKQIQSATQRAIDIIKSLQDFTQPQSKQNSLLNIGDEIKTTLIFSKSLTRYINVKLSLPKIPLFVKVQKDLFQQIIFNLIQNAVHAMNNQGDLIIHVVNNSSFVEILVQDSGPGIPNQLREAVFTPLFTTKQLGQGTGLGLAFVKGVIEAWNGWIGVTDPINNFTGACFLVRLPLALKGTDEN